jgi:hypothetical protein
MGRGITMNCVDIPSKVFLNSVENHQTYKNQILESIKSMGSFSLNEPNISSIYNSDWHLNRQGFESHYYDLVKPVLLDHIETVRSFLNYKKLEITNYWFQQYKKDDFHIWHTHGGCLFSSVYYVELAEDNPITTFKMGELEFKVPVKEGDIITFPSFLAHCSPINQSETIKTVISFNLNGKY